MSPNRFGQALLCDVQIQDFRFYHYAFILLAYGLQLVYIL